MLCVKCNKNTAEIYISGKYLCKFCARDEIVKRIRRELSSTRFLDKNDAVLIIFPSFYKELPPLLSSIIGKICKECNLTFNYLEISDNIEINRVLWNIIIAIKNAKENKIILPFTSDFYLSYLIYSSSIGNYSYIYLYNIILKIFDKTVFIPLYNTPITELKGFSEITGELNVKDELFNQILGWARSNFTDNEIYHSFGNSIDVILANNKNRCLFCNAILASPDSNYCKYCSESFSPLYSKQFQNKAEEAR